MSRNIPSVEGIGSKLITGLIDDSSITYDSASEGGSAQVGMAVVFAHGSPASVELSRSAGKVCGQLISVEKGGICTVKVRGFMDLPTVSTAFPDINVSIAGDSTRGAVRPVTTALADCAVARGTTFNTASAGGDILVYL